MQISSRFTLALHLCTCMEVFKGEHKVTSEFLAKSVNTNPVIVRNILGQLRKAGLVTVQRGAGGATLARPAAEISFFDIYEAVECIDEGQLFHFHENPNEACTVGRNIHTVLDHRLEDIQKTLEAKLSSMKLSEVVKEMKSCLK